MAPKCWGCPPRLPPPTRTALVASCPCHAPVCSLPQPPEPMLSATATSGGEQTPLCNTWGLQSCQKQPISHGQSEAPVLHRGPGQLPLPSPVHLLWTLGIRASSKALLVSLLLTGLFEGHYHLPLYRLVPQASPPFTVTLSLCSFHLSLLIPREHQLLSTVIATF